MEERRKAALAEKIQDVEEEEVEEEKECEETPPDEEGGGAIAKLAGASVKGQFSKVYSIGLNNFTIDYWLPSDYSYGYNLNHPPL